MDSPPEKKRLYVGGLFDGVKDEDLIERFSKFGQVKSVELKSRHNEEGPTINYAFLEMMITPRNLAKCFNVYSNTRWKNCEMKLEVAKESFLTRLQKEREQAPKSIGKEEEVKPPKNEEKETKPHKKDAIDSKLAKKRVYFDNEKDDGNRTVSKKLSVNSLSPSKKSKSKVPMFGGTAMLLQDESKEHVVPPDAKKAKKLNSASNQTIQDKPLEHSVRVNFTANRVENGYQSNVRPDIPNGQHLANQKPTSGLLSRLEKFSGTWNDFEVVGSDLRRPPVVNDMTEKKILSNKKRLESILSKQSEVNTKQKIVKDALKNLDSNMKVNKKIVFDDNYGESNIATDQSAIEVKTKKKKEKSSAGERNLALFDSDSEEDLLVDSQEMFRVKPQYEGEAGQKIIALQSRFGNDERFKLDKRFVEDDAEEDHGEEATHEKQRQLGVLNDVLGYELPQKPKDKMTKDWTKMKQMRYDPTMESAAELEIDLGEKAEKRKKKIMSKTDQASKEGENTVDEPLPEVSKERYFKVSTSLKDIFRSDKSDKSFSLLQSYGDMAQSTDTRNRSMSDAAVHTNATSLPRTAWDNNPFKYDSTDEEEEDEKPWHTNHNDGILTDNQSNLSTPRRTFFVFDGDARLLDGVKFFVRPNNLDEVRLSWKETRSRLMEGFRDKLRKAQTKKDGKTNMAKVFSKMKSRFKTKKKNVLRKKRQ